MADLGISKDTIIYNSWITKGLMVMFNTDLSILDSSCSLLKCVYQISNATHSQDIYLYGHTFFVWQKLTTTCSFYHLIIFFGFKNYIYQPFFVLSCEKDTVYIRKICIMCWFKKLHLKHKTVTSWETTSGLHKAQCDNARTTIWDFLVSDRHKKKTKLTYCCIL